MQLKSALRLQGPLLSPQLCGFAPFLPKSNPDFASATPTLPEQPGRDAADTGTRVPVASPAFYK